MIVFITGLVIFFGLHIFSAVRTREPGQDLRVRMGEGPYMGLYSLVSLVGFALMIYGYILTRGGTVLYIAPVWGRHVTLALMLPALILLVASQLPASWIKKVTKHPMLVAVKIWALSHLLANGELNAVILFGSFLGYAVFDRIMVKRRAVSDGPAASPSVIMDVISVVAGSALYVALYLWLHPVLFGVRIAS
ncbi:MAG: NnrU family protein [Pseudomonadota bacterium]